MRDTVVIAADRDSAEWWRALRRHELCLQTCSGCARRRWPPRAICNACGSFDWRWTPATGTGTVASWTVTHRPPSRDVEVPYVVLLVRLDDQDDIFMPGGWSGASDGHDLAIGLAVRAGYREVVDQNGEPAAILCWEPAVGDSIAGDTVPTRRGADLR